MVQETTSLTDTSTTAIDPVCGMTVDPIHNAGQSVHKGKKYYFCSVGCMDKFKVDADRYAAPGSHGAAPAAAAEYTCSMHPDVKRPGPCPKCGMALEAVTPVAIGPKTEYTCPMHPQIVRDGPGACPICGMALELREVTGEEANPELTDMTRRFRISLALTTPILVLMVSELFPSDPIKHLLGSGLSLWMQFALSTPVVLWGGWPFFQRGLASVVNRHLNMFTLIAMGTGASYLYSVYALLFPRLIPASFHDMGGGLVPNCRIKRIVA